MGRVFKSFRKRSFLLVIVLLIITTVCIIFQPEPRMFALPLRGDYIFVDFGMENVSEVQEIREWLQLRNATKNLTKLGRVLFLDEEEPKALPKKFKILVWKYGGTLVGRHIQNYSNKTINPFEHCPTKNCDITYRDESIKTADIVIFHMHRMKGTADLPKGQRNPKQIWAFLTDESPVNTFMTSHVKLTNFNGIFNWSMTYRMDSDIPVPYGRTVLKKERDETEEILLNKRRDVLVAILGSDCFGASRRWDYIKELQKYIKVDVYGKCGSLNKCPGHFRADCPDINKYLFYLSFENSNCDEYITEKVWWNAYNKNSIPIVMGGDRLSYRKILPSHSYINVDDFAAPSVLAEFILRLNRTGEFKEYYRWKKNFQVLNEHAYFQSLSYHFCRVCQALNYNDKQPKVYKKLDEFWSVKRDCHPPWNAWHD